MKINMINYIFSVFLVAVVFSIWKVKHKFV